MFTKSNNKIICGVCAGLAEHFNVDPRAVRIVTAIWVCLDPAALALYALAAILLPNKEI
jgi:phage shock protein PspC (stress-responsive transcriptional regulator)